MKPAAKKETPKMQAAPVIPETQVPDFQFSTSEKWSKCAECKEQVYREVNGKTYYHRLKCSKSNGIAYRADRCHTIVTSKT